MGGLTLRSGPQEALKWAALVLMALDHVASLFLDGPVYTALRMAGRLAFPLFAALLAYNLVVRRVPVARYLVPLSVLAVVSQLPYTLAFGPRGNVFVALLVGVVLVGLAQRVRARGLTGETTLLLVVTVLGVVFFHPLVDYGMAGLLLVPAWAAWFAAPFAPVAVLLLFDMVALNWGTVGALVPLAVPAVLLLASGWRFDLRRLPRWVAYAFYPAHISVLLLLKVVLFPAA